MTPGTRSFSARIYGMRDPRDGRIRYVGKTRQTFVARLGGHIAETKRNPEAAKSLWLRDLLSMGLRPEMVELADCPPDMQEGMVEAEEIRRHASDDSELLNIQCRRGELIAQIMIRVMPEEKRELERRAAAAEKELQKTRPRAKLGLGPWMIETCLAAQAPEDAPKKKGGPK